MLKKFIQKWLGLDERFEIVESVIDKVKKIKR